MKTTLPVSMLLAVTCATASDFTPSHCSPDETRIFSCVLGTKLVSLCASPDLGPEQGYLQYRYGSPGTSELTYPQRRDIASRHFAAGARADKEMTADWIRFDKDGYSYTVFATSGKNAEDKEGLIVQKTGKHAALFLCMGKASNGLGSEFSGRAGLRKDTKPFQIP